MGYTVTADFGSGVTGQLRKGETVDLEPDVAAWVNEQLPGTLTTGKAAPRGKKTDESAVDETPDAG